LRRERHGGRAAHGADARLVAHVELHRTLKVQVPLHARAWPDHDARLLQIGVEPAGFLHHDAALHARAAQQVDVAADRAQPAAHMGTVEHDVAIDVPDGATPLDPAAELDLPVDRLDAATHAHGLPEGYRPVHCVHG